MSPLQTLKDKESSAVSLPKRLVKLRISVTVIAVFSSFIGVTFHYFETMIFIITLLFDADIMYRLVTFALPEKLPLQVHKEKARSIQLLQNRNE